MAVTEEARVAHVWRRLGFGPAQGDIDAGVAAGGAGALIDSLLARPVTTVADWKWPATVGDGADKNRLTMRLFELWATSPGVVQERVSWFLEGLIVAGITGSIHAKEMRAYFNLVRAWPTGSYTSLLESVAGSAAMQLYLSGVNSVPPHANENLARELMELFSLGVTHPRTGATNYGESDVKEIARALTGYRFNYDSRVLSFNSTYWDGGNKTFLGADRGAAKLPDVIDAIAAQDSYRFFVPAKLYRSLLGFDPSARAMDDMAQVWGTDGDLTSLVAHIAHRPEFLADSTIANRVKPPVDLLVSAFRAIGKKDLSSMKMYSLADQVRQDPERPPDVAGWSEDWLHPSHIITWSRMANVLCRSDNGPSADGGSYATPASQWNVSIRYLFNNADRTTAAEMAFQLAGLTDVSPQSLAAVDNFARTQATATEAWTFQRACGVMQLVLISPEFMVG